jgi:hypothetical protein
VKLLSQVIEVGESRLRPIAVVVTQLREELAHIGKGLSRGGGDCSESFVNGVGITLTDVSRTVGLGYYYRERVSNNIMHVSGYAVPFLFDRDDSFGVSPGDSILTSGGDRSHE